MITYLFRSFVGDPYVLASAKSQCIKGGSNQGMLSKQRCYLACKGKSVLFYMSRQDSGYCKGEACICHCYPGRYQGGHCPTIFMANDDLYRIREGNKPFKTLESIFSGLKILDLLQIFLRVRVDVDF